MAKTCRCHLRCQSSSGWCRTSCKASCGSSSTRSRIRRALRLRRVHPPHAHPQPATAPQGQPRNTTA
eukprot:scaffold3461_cov116-Isochrysis_galbana.AAC.4